MHVKTRTILQQQQRCNLYFFFHAIPNTATSSRFIRRQHAARFLQGVSEQPDVACRNPGECSVTAGIGHHDHSFIQDFAIPEQEFVSESAEPGQAEFSDDS